MATVTELMMALGSPDPAVRVPAEQTVQQAKEADIANFILTVLVELRDETKPAFARNMAGTLLKNSVAPSFREVAARRALEDKWKSLPAHVRQKVKDEVLATLGSSNRDVRNVASNIIGSLSRIELPSGEWPNLIDILVSGAQSGSPQHQEAALTAIGYICEEGHDHNVEGALGSSTGQILSAIVQHMGSTNDEVQYAATNALCNAMEYIHATMEQQSQRDYLLDALCTTTKTCGNPRTREKAMACIVRVAELYYATLPNYISRLHEITTSAIFNDVESVGLQALQFWISICEVERGMAEDGDVSQCLNYAAQGASFLIDICLRLLVQQEDDQTEDDWNLSCAGSKLLQCLAETIGVAVHKPVMDFVYSNINSTDWRSREASVMAFGCILGNDSSDVQDAIQDTVAQGVPGLLNYLQDSHPMVADTSAWALAIVCENFPDVFLQQPQVLRQLLNVVGPIIGAGASAMGIRACHIVHNLALAYVEEEDQRTNELSPFFADLVTVLLNAIDNGSTHELKSSAQETLNVLVDSAAEDSIPCLTTLAPELHKRMQFHIQLASQGNPSMETEIMLGLLCGTLSGLARKLNVRFGDFINPFMQLLNELISMKANCVQEETLVAIGSIAYAAKERLEPYLERIIPYMLSVLQDFDEPENIYSVVAAIGDLCLSVGPLLRSYVNSIMDTLYNNLCNTEVDRELKCSFIKCFGDIILNVLQGEGFTPFAPTLLPLVNQIFEASCGIDIRGDADGEQYVMSLWESTACLYSSVIQCFRHVNVSVLAPYLAGMLRFALHAANHASDYPETAQAALMVVGDMASVLRYAEPRELRQQSKEACLTPAVKQVLDQALRNASGDDRTQLLWIQSQLEQLQRS